jgi:tRNA threonylcarbamoyladenosine modification (KEOPS) complex  Pcc1 subunit
MKEAEVVVEFPIEEEAEDEQTSIKQQFNVTDVIDLDISNMNVPL